MIMTAEEISHIVRVNTILGLVNELPESEAKRVLSAGAVMLVGELPQDVRDAAFAGDIQPLVFATRDPK